MELIIQNSTGQEIEEALFTEVFNRASSSKSVELLITDNAEIQQFNAKYRGKDQATDVLSFPLDDDELLGQIIISLEKAQAQAKELGQTIQEELQFLFAHGLAHLLGHDHQNEEEEATMLAFVYKLINRTS